MVRASAEYAAAGIDTDIDTDGDSDTDPEKARELPNTTLQPAKRTHPDKSALYLLETGLLLRTSRSYFVSGVPSARLGSAPAGVARRQG
jgi:hypothetical protein